MNFIAKCTMSRLQSEPPYDTALISLLTMLPHVGHNRYYECAVTVMYEYYIYICVCILYFSLTASDVEGIVWRKNGAHYGAMIIVTVK